MNSRFLNKSDLQILPLEKSQTIPSNWYTDKNIFEFEKEAVFSKEWQYAGHISQLTTVGDYFLA
jgi:choline monooxygenase